MKPKPLKPRRMWSTEQFFTVPGACESLLRDEKARVRHCQPVLVLSLDPANVEAMVASTANVLDPDSVTWAGLRRQYALKLARAVLASLGVKESKP